MKTAAFNEEKLRQEIIDKWGEFGAHAEVFNMIMKELNAYRNELQRIYEKYGYEQTGEVLKTRSPEVSLPGEGVEQAAESKKAFEKWMMSIAAINNEFEIFDAGFRAGQKTYHIAKDL